MGKRQCLEMSMKRTRARLGLTGSPLCHLQVGAEGREGEGCGTVGLLLEHSFEIGEFSDVPAGTLALCPVKSGTAVRVLCSVRHHALTFSLARECVCITLGCWG